MLITPSDSKYPSSWTDSAVKELFQDGPHQSTLNTTNTKSSSTAFVTPNLVVKEPFQDGPHQSTSNMTNMTITTNTTSSSTVSVIPTPASQQPHSRSHLGRGVPVGLIVGGITASLLCAAIIVYMIKKRRRNTEKPIESFAVSTTSQVPSHDQEHNELSIERVPREIMSARSDRAELPHTARAELPVFVSRIETVDELDNTYCELSTERESRESIIERSDRAELISRIRTLIELNGAYASNID